MDLHIVLTDNVRRARNGPFFRKRFGSYDDQAIGLCVWEGDTMALFFSRPHLSHKLIAHEINHATHAIMNQRSIATGGRGMCYETPAILCEHITGLVYGDMKRWKAKIR